MKGLAGIIPTLITSGIITPGVFGPITIASFCFAISKSSKVSLTGTCSGIAIKSLIPASRASLPADKKNFAGTKTIETFAPVASTASFTELKIGTPSNFSPPFPGVTPAAMFVPYSNISFVWCDPNFPVIP